MNFGKKRAIVVLAVAAVSISGCAAIQSAFGGDKVVPDEFRVVAKAPLVVPPEFNLRPPRPGETRPLELRPDMQARSALFGVVVGQQAGAGERQLITDMGANNADPRIRDILDSETGSLARKPISFSDRLLGRAPGPMDTSAPVASAEEAARMTAERDSIARATGGGQPTIQQQRPSGIKLPGL